jgi:hypothetical protein
MVGIVEDDRVLCHASFLQLAQTFAHEAVHRGYAVVVAGEAASHTVHIRQVGWYLDVLR